MPLKHLMSWWVKFKNRWTEIEHELNKTYSETLLDLNLQKCMFANAEKDKTFWWIRINLCFSDLFLNWQEMQRFLNLVTLLDWYLLRVLCIRDWESLHLVMFYQTKSNILLSVKGKLPLGHREQLSVDEVHESFVSIWFGKMKKQKQFFHLWIWSLIISSSQICLTLN